MHKAIGELEDVLTSHPEVMSGRTVFRGTRVPLEAVVNNLVAGLSLDEVLDSSRRSIAMTSWRCST